MFEENQPAPQVADTEELQGQVNSGANWFFWIAGLSLVNSLIIFFDGDRSFAIGLGITQIVDAIASVSVADGASTIVKTLALVFDVIVIAVFVGFGFLGRARHLWAFIVGIALFALDSLIFVIAFDFIGIAIHALALFFLVRGMLAVRQINAMPAADPAA